MVDVNLFIFLAGAFILTIVIGKLLEKIRVPWIFGALLVGTGLAAYNPFASVTSSATFSFLANLGMYFLLLLIGYEIDMKEMMQKAGFIFKSTFFIIFFEAIFGTLLIHFIFGTSWLLSTLVAVSFATVGEAILIPILDEFRITNTKLGQSIIGIGTLDDVIEIATIILAGVLVGVKNSVPGTALPDIFVIIGIFAVLIAMAIVIRKARHVRFRSINMMFIFMMMILFLFLGIGQYGESAAFAALLAGIALRGFLPKERLGLIGDQIRMLCYGFFAPMFFLSVGLELDLSYVFSSFLIVVIVVVVTTLAKITSSYIMGKKKMGARQSVLMGIGLSIRFSTSIIIIKILLDTGLIGISLYSVIVASNIVFNFVVPVLFSNLVVKWRKYIK